MTKIALNDLASLTNETSSINLINVNNAEVENKSDDFLSRTGVAPNAMLTDLDMNSNQILNLPAPSSVTDPVRLGDLPALGGIVNITNNLFGGLNVQDFGAIGNGIHDDTAAIQNAINALPVTGGIVYFPSGNYKITSSITIGNGTTSALSTRYGVVLKGLGISNRTPAEFSTGYSSTVTPKITWAGGINSQMIVIAGPLEGWGLQNLVLDGAGTAGTIGIFIKSGRGADNHNLTVVGCPNSGINSTTSTKTGYSGINNVDSIHNNWFNTCVEIPATSSAAGIVLGGASDGTSDTDFNTFTNTIIRFVGNTSGFGIYLSVADGNVFTNTTISSPTGATTNTGIVLDYSVNTTFPSSNMFIGIDPGAIGTNFTTIGTPASGARPNYIKGLLEANSGISPTGTGWYVDFPVVITPGIDLVNQTATIGFTAIPPINPAWKTGMYRLNYYLETTTAGAAGTVTLSVGWADDTAGSPGFTTTTLSLASAGFLSGTVPIRHKSGSTLAYATTVAGAAGSPKYDLHIRLEKMD